MEMEYFVRPGEDEAAHQEWIDNCFNWYTSLGLSRDNLRLYEQPEEELAHYAKRTVDIHYRFFPERAEEEKHWDELMGIANRTDFDLKAHSKNPVNEEGKRLNPDSTEDLSYFDEARKERYYPYVIEPAAGVNRSVLAFLMDAYSERTNDKGETRVILKLHPELAPIKWQFCRSLRTSRRSSEWRKRSSAICNPRCAPSTTTRAASANSTRGRTRSARPSASPSIINRSKTKPSPSATATPGNRSASKSRTCNNTYDRD
jgi:glycyl-tRNA synthetase (class II)